MSVAARLAGLLLAPEEPARSPVADASAQGSAPALAVVGPAREARVAGAALALMLARAGRLPIALLCTWATADAHPPAGRAPAHPRAGRLAAALSARDHRAAASGRLVEVLCSADETSAVAELRRALAAGGVPTVLAAGRPRGEAMEALLAEQDRVVAVVAADADEALVELAAAGLGDTGRPATCCRVPAGGRAEAVALRGLGVPGPVRRSLEGVAAPNADRVWAPESGAQRGQASVLLVGLLCAVTVGALWLGLFAGGLGAQGAQQRAADMGALAAAKAMHGHYARLFEPPLLGARRNPAALSRAAYLALGRRAALITARRNGARRVRVGFPDGRSFAPVRVRVRVLDPVRVARRTVPAGAVAEAELAPPAAYDVAGVAGAGEYTGPLAHRQGKPMRPDVARAFDRLAAAARAAGHHLVITSAFRSNAEQAALFARNPDPKWVAPPGRSLHRLGTELDLGPPSAYAWLAANARRFHFVQRYSWEPWHYGYTLNAGSGRVGYAYATGDGRRSRGLPSFVPERFAAPIGRAAQRWNVSAALLAAQLYAESNFNPFAVSPAGARGIAQFMPATARAYGLRDPFDAAAAIDAQGRLMRDLLRRFASVPLALAAYNAGPAPVARCGCIPPYPETRGYVARILGLLGGAGEAPAGGGLEVRLVR